MNLNKTCWVPTTETPVKVVKKRSQRSHTNLADKCHPGKSCKQHWTQEEFYICSCCPCPMKRNCHSRSECSCTSTGSHVPSPTKCPPYRHKQSKCNLPQKGLLTVSRDMNPIKLVIVLQIFLAGCPFPAIFALKVHVLNYIMTYKLNAISNLNLYKCQLSSSPVSPMRLPTAVLESTLLCRHYATHSKKLLLKE